jgi:catechol 2,3-dioxygenase-like lactoylglutathione lyase family enzyme
MSYRPKYLGHVNIYVRNVERSLHLSGEPPGLRALGGIDPLALAWVSC